MNILICSDGTPASDNAARLGGLLAGGTKAQVTLLGIAENPSDEQPLRQALEQETEILRRAGVEPQTAIQTGEPTAQILGETSAKKYDLIVIGSRRRNASGRTYESIKQLNRRFWSRSEPENGSRAFSFAAAANILSTRLSGLPARWPPRYTQKSR